MRSRMAAASSNPSLLAADLQHYEKAARQILANSTSDENSADTCHAEDGVRALRVVPSAQPRAADGRENQRWSRLEPNRAFSAASAADGSWKVPVGLEPLRKSTSTRPTRSCPNST